MPQYNRNDLEIAARNQHFTRDTSHLTCLGLLPNMALILKSKKPT